MTLGVPLPAQAELSVLEQPVTACSSWPTNPLMPPPAMSAVALAAPWGPPRSLSMFVWYGWSQPPRAGSGTHTLGVPPAIGMPSTPGYVPKYVSNERFSCMITTTCLIRWMSVAALPVGETSGDAVLAEAPRDGATDSGWEPH